VAGHLQRFSPSTKASAIYRLCSSSYRNDVLSFMRQLKLSVRLASVYNQILQFLFQAASTFQLQVVPSKSNL